MRARIQGLGWVVRRVADPGPLATWYREVVGLPLLRPDSRVPMMWTGEFQSFEVVPGGAPPPPYTDRDQAPCVFILQCHGIQGTIDRLAANGAVFINDFDRDGNRLAYFVDPGGHVTGLQERSRVSDRPEDIAAWRAWDEGGVRLPGVPPLAPDVQHIGWIVLRGADPPGLLAFFRDIVGLAVAKDNGARGGLLRLGDGVLLEVGAGGAPQPVPADRAEVANTFILRVWDLDGIVADLAANGARFVNPPFAIPHGRIAYFLTPENHLIGLQQRDPSSDRVEDIEAARAWRRRH